MDWLTALVDLVKALAWPSAALLIVFLFRKPLLSLISAVETVKFKGLEVSIARQIEEVKREVALSLPSAAELRLKGPTTTEHLYQLALISPRAAIMEAWRELELGGMRAVAKAFPEGVPPHFRSPNSIGEALRSKELISSEQYNTIMRLRKIRNEAIHANDVRLDVDAANDYVDLAVTINAQLEKLA